MQTNQYKYHAGLQNNLICFQIFNCDYTSIEHIQSWLQYYRHDFSLTIKSIITLEQNKKNLIFATMYWQFLCPIQLLLHQKRMYPVW